MSNALDLTQTKPPPGLRPSGGAGGQDRCSFRLKARPCHRSRRSAILIRNHKSQSWTSIGNDRTKESRGATGTRRGSGVNVRRGFQRLVFGLVLSLGSVLDERLRCALAVIRERSNAAPVLVEDGYRSHHRPFFWRLGSVVASARTQTASGPAEAVHARKAISAVLVAGGEL